jgi:hypothetical protein
MSSSVGSQAGLQKRMGKMLPGLSKAEAQVLGLLSYGILLFNGCAMSRLSKGLAKIVQVPAERLRQRLREFGYEAEPKHKKNDEKSRWKRALPICRAASCKGGRGKRSWP